MTEKQKRQPIGVPVGGQFVTGERHEGEDLWVESTEKFQPSPVQFMSKDTKHTSLTEAATLDTILLNDASKPRSARIAAGCRSVGACSWPARRCCAW